MKKGLLVFLIGLMGFTQAQTVLNNAIVTMKMETVSEGGGDGFQMPPNETEMKVYIRDSMSKIELTNNFMHSITLMDKLTGISTNLMEMQGEKTGYTQSNEDREAFRLRMDSIRKAQQEASGSGGDGGPGRMVIRMGGNTTVKNIDYIEETKVINGINCKKAIVTTANEEGVESKITVWYTEDFVIPRGVNIAGRGMMNFENLKGMPVSYETIRTMNFNGNEISMITTFQITDIKKDAKIEDKEFALPKGYKIKTYNEWIKDNPNGMPGGGMRMMIRGGGGG
jgi:hypothetical protein